MDDTYSISKLFETQKLLDNRIVDEHKLHGQDLLTQKILALQVELGELANEWRGFKFWSKDQEPRTEHECDVCEGEGTITLATERMDKGEQVTYIDCQCCNGDGYLDKNPLLEEFVDCLHFILSIGNDINFKLDEWDIEPYHKGEIIKSFNHVFRMVSDFEMCRSHYDLVHIIDAYLGLGEILGFVWEEIEQAYYAKNAINHTRQDEKY